MFRLLGGGVAGDFHGLPRPQLAVLPGTTLITVVDRTDWLLSMLRRSSTRRYAAAVGAVAMAGGVDFADGRSSRG